MKGIIFLGVMLTATTILLGQTHDYDDQAIIFGHDTNKLTIGSSTIQTNGNPDPSTAILEVTSDTGSFFRLGGSTAEIFLFASDIVGHRLLTPSGSPLDINSVMRVDRDYATFNTTYIPTDYVIAVGGDIIAEGIRVELESNWPDYVFASNYNLMPLSQVEQYITDNGHLPNVPSAQNMEEEGIDLGNMVTRQMEKIEELTLYIIALQKEIEALKAKN